MDEMASRETLIENYAKLHAKALFLYGVDIEGKFETAVQMSFALEQAYMRGKQDQIDKFARWRDEHPTIEAVPVVQAESIRKEAVEDFAKWCYINGIDFSYMHKATDTEPFCKRVLKRYEEEQGKKV